MSPFKVWENVFLTKRTKRAQTSDVSKRARTNNGQAQAVERQRGLRFLDTSDEASSFDQMLQLIHGNSEYNKLVQGCFENYLLGRNVHSDKTEYVCDWLVLHDQLDQHINHKQDYALYKYLPYTVMAFFSQFNGNDRRAIRFPRFVCHD